MTERIDQELDLLRSKFPNLQYHQDGTWILVQDYPGPPGIWSLTTPDVCFQVPPAYPGQKPYGFYVRLPFSLSAGGEINNATASDEPPFEGPWLKFSWDMPDWQATSDLHSGSNLLNWTLSFRKRLEEGA